MASNTAILGSNPAVQSAQTKTNSTDTLWYVSGAILLGLALLLRLWVFPVMTADFTDSIIPWLNNLASNPGFTAFKYPFSDYPPLYLYMLKFIAVAPVNKLFAVKSLSVVFDFIIAFTVYKIFSVFNTRKYTQAQLFFIFSLCLAVPTVLINSSMWAQCDAIYAACVLGAFYYILRDLPALAVMAFAVAICLKLQTIFFAPILIGYLWARSRPHFWEYVALIPLTYFVLLIPAWFSGGSFAVLMTKYLNQSKEYQALTLSAPSAFSLVDDHGMSQSMQNLLGYAGIALTALVAFSLITLVYKLIKASRFTPVEATFVALLSVLLVPFFLPHMHERYFYLADIFSLIFALYRPGYWYVPVAVVCASFLAYMPFLSKSVPALATLIVPTAMLGLILAAVITSLIPRLVHLIKQA